MSRRWLIAVSTVAHVAVGVGLFTTGIWQLEQLERPRSRLDIGVQPPPPPPPAGGPVAAVKVPDIVRKKTRPPVTTQPTRPDDKPAPTTSITTEVPGPEGPGETPDGPCLDNCGPAAPALAAVCGNNSLEVGEQCDDGNTTSNDGCSATCATEPRPKPPTAIVSTSVMQALRQSGETQIQPSSSTQNRMSRDGQTETIGSVQLCIATDGAVASAAMVRSTRYSDYDATLLAAVRGWRYRPYTVQGVAVRACSLVTFRYKVAR